MTTSVEHNSVGRSCLAVRTCTPPVLHPLCAEDTYGCVPDRRVDGLGARADQPASDDVVVGRIQWRGANEDL